MFSLVHPARLLLLLAALAEQPHPVLAYETIFEAAPLIDIGTGSVGGRPLVERKRRDVGGAKAQQHPGFVAGPVQERAQGGVLDVPQGEAVRAAKGRQTDGPHTLHAPLFTRARLPP